MTDPIILENLTKSFGAQEVVKDLNLSIKKGSTIGLIGCNGAGKTTTIAMIMGLTTPTSGRVIVLGHDMSHRPPEVLKKINFQSPYIGMPAQLSVLQNLKIFGGLYSVKNLKNRIDEVVSEFDLSEVVNRQTGQLSAGQKTRVSLAKALLNHPEILLLDEPTASLDPERAEWVRQHLLKYQKNHQATILVSSHNMYEVEQLCDFVALMSYGQLTQFGTSRDMIKHMYSTSIDEYIDYPELNTSIQFAEH